MNAIETLAKHEDCFTLSAVDSLVTVEVNWVSKRYDNLVETAMVSALVSGLNRMAAATAPTSQGAKFHNDIANGRKKDADHANFLSNDPSLVGQLRFYKGVQNLVRNARQLVCEDFERVSDVVRTGDVISSGRGLLQASS